MRHGVRSSILGAAAWLLLAPSTALGQVQSKVSQFDVERLVPSPMAECSLVVGCGEAGVAGTFRLAAAAFSTGTPLVLRDGDHVGGGGYASPVAFGDVIALRHGVQLLGAWAIRDGLELHGVLPMVVNQAGDDLSHNGIEQPGAWGNGSPVLGVRWTAFSERSGAPLTAALRLDAVLPLGWRPALAGNPGWVLRPRVEVASWSDEAVLAAEVGANLRDRQVQLGVDHLGSEVTWALAVAGRSQPLRAEFAILCNVSSQGFGVEPMVGARLQAGLIELYFMAGMGFGQSAGTPFFRALAGLAWSGASGATGAPIAPPSQAAMP
jgi:hypothetical protein